jgi:hypothetical protein
MIMVAVTAYTYTLLYRTDKDIYAQMLAGKNTGGFSLFFLTRPWHAYGILYVDRM